MKNKKIGIYKITSPTKKVYIGQSTDIINRCSKYKTLKCNKQPKIYRSIIKHGWDTHIFEIVEICDIELLDEREIFWKNYYVDTLGWENILFCHLIDTKGGYKSEETKQKIRNSKKGKLYGDMKDDHKQKLRKSALDRNDSLKKRLKNNNFRSKSIVQLDMDNNVINIYTSIKEASKKTNINYCSIQQTACKKQQTAGGYKWKYK
jgi:group I intron endonuclease